MYEFFERYMRDEGKHKMACMVFLRDTREIKENIKTRVHDALGRTRERII